MNCKELRGQMFEYAGSEPLPAAVAQHVASCAACGSELEGIRKTMSLLDEWQAPADVSPYFMTRLRARVREEDAAPARGWLDWVRKPALAGIMALVLVAIGGLSMLRLSETPSQRAEAPLTAGTAVGDLQYLDGNVDLLANFELLDEVDSHN